MRRTLTLCRTGLAGAAAFVLLTACGGGSSEDSASSTTSSSAAETTSSASSSSAEASGPQAGSEFCQEAAGLDDELNNIADVSDPAQFADVLQQVADRLGTIEPPAEISADWDSLVGAIDQLAQAAADTDFNNPDQAAAFAQQASQLETQLGTASTNVEAYLNDQCGIDTGGTDTASPTT